MRRDAGVAGHHFKSAPTQRFTVLWLGWTEQGGRSHVSSSHWPTRLGFNGMCTVALPPATIRATEAYKKDPRTEEQHDHQDGSNFRDRTQCRAPGEWPEHITDNKYHTRYEQYTCDDHQCKHNL